MTAIRSSTAAPTTLSPAQILGEPLTFRRGGFTVKNRLLKSAMSEVLGSPAHAPTVAHERLYEAWARGGLGLAITGNVMVDRRALGEPGNVVVEDERDLAALTRWASAGKQGGCRVWMQINHPGKQSPTFLSREPVAPSAVPLGAGLESAFATPRALEPHEIEALVERFATTAAIARKAGFDGVQIHGAHGYLVSQFLSPHHNRRDDAWGGTLEKRARFAREVLAAMRRAVGEGFPIGIKINSADFQRGGFGEDESLEVIRMLVDGGIDLIEISGGTYEAPAMTGAEVRESTRQREAYFLAFAERVRAAVDVPLALTGGFRTAEGMASAVSSGAVDLVGLARALALEPDLPRRVLSGEAFVSRVRPLSTGVRKVDQLTALDVSWYEHQLARLGAGKPTDPGLGPWRSVVMSIAKLGVAAVRMRRARG
ncbi:MAG: NADH:flavin oxidoreductase/NADH oxidase family protein [Deltaproteobacteria bacterium]|nr:NADH:flavin oxidoreductase/NADH oxidase family protein [Deltaproteobacteria bacterium]